MRNLSKMEERILVFATAVTVLAIGLWLATGRDAYTKFEVVEEVEKPVDPNDPLAGTGFYDSNTKKEVVRRPEFRFGLLPTPSGIFDKHALSVATLTGPVWGMVVMALLLGRRRRKQKAATLVGPGAADPRRRNGMRQAMDS